MHLRNALKKNYALLSHCHENNGSFSAISSLLLSPSLPLPSCLQLSFIPSLFLLLTLLVFCSFICQLTNPRPIVSTKKPTIKQAYSSTQAQSSTPHRTRGKLNSTANCSWHSIKFKRQTPGQLFVTTSQDCPDSSSSSSSVQMRQAREVDPSGAPLSLLSFVPDCRSLRALWK